MGNGDVGYSVIRFKANNPGVWALHCHIGPHMASGMMMVFVVPKSGGSGGPWALPGGADKC